MTSDLCEEDVVRIAAPQILSADAFVSTLGANATPSVSRVQTSSAAVDLGRRLLLAARSGDTATVLDLMAKGAPFTTDWLGTSPLHLAAANGHVQTCAVLLRAGVTRDSRTKVERTPLHLAAHAGQTEVVVLLLDHGAIIDCRDMLHMTPLHWAAARGHAAAARALVRRGADVRVRCKFRHTPRTLAARHGHAHLAAALERAEADALAAPPAPPAPPAELAEETRKALGIESLTKTPEIKIEKPTLKSQQESLKQYKLPESKSEGAGSEAAAQLLRAHGIALLPPDDGSTVLSAIQSGRTVVLSDAGKLMLKESELPAEAVSEGTPSGVGKSEEGRGGVVLRATPVRAPPRGVKVFSVNHKLVLPAASAAPGASKTPVKKVINPQDVQQMKFVQLSSEGAVPQVKNVTMKAKNRRPGPVKIFMNKSNFNKLIANAKANVIPAPLQGGEALAAAPAEGGGAEEVRRLRAQLAGARAALAAAAADLRAARSRLALYEPGAAAPR